MRDQSCIQAFWWYHSLFQIDFGEMKSSIWRTLISWHISWVEIPLNLFPSIPLIDSDFVCIYSFLWIYRESSSKDRSKKKSFNPWLQFQFLISIFNVSFQFHFNFNFQFQMLIFNFNFQFQFQISVLNLNFRCQI